jgi:hypothetical protein
MGEPLTDFATLSSHNIHMDPGQGSNIAYGPDQLEVFKIAVTEFSKVTDTNATLIPSFFFFFFKSDLYRVTSPRLSTVSTCLLTI